VHALSLLRAQRTLQSPESAVMAEVTEYTLSRHLEPICPRDDHVMRFEARGIAWKALPTDRRRETMPSYHCNFGGCSVRYDPANGYFTVVLEPEQPYFVEEPGVNLFQCPTHGAWLYRTKDQHTNSHLLWRCPVESCTYTHADPTRT